MIKYVVDTIHNPFVGLKTTIVTSLYVWSKNYNDKSKNAPPVQTDAVKVHPSSNKRDEYICSIDLKSELKLTNTYIKDRDKFTNSIKISQYEFLDLMNLFRYFISNEKDIYLQKRDGSIYVNEDYVKRKKTIFIVDSYDETIILEPSMLKLKHGYYAENDIEAVETPCVIMHYSRLNLSCYTSYLRFKYFTESNVNLNIDTRGRESILIAASLYGLKNCM